MDRTYYIIVPQFTSIAEALDYLSRKTSYSFNFSVGTKIYDTKGNEIVEPTNFEIIPIEGLAMQIYEFTEDLWPGQTYIQDDFIKYFKELTL